MPRSVLLRLGLMLPLLSGCEYAGLLRPSVIEQLDPPVARLVNELPNVDRPNEGIVARLYATGGLGHAEPGPDGVMRIEVWAVKGQLIWRPAIISMPHGGELELIFHNPDDLHHAALMPSNGDRQVLQLPIHASGAVRIRLDQPGYHWFGCPVGNHAGRGMLGLILVKGEVPPDARLDRPPQPQPKEE